MSDEVKVKKEKGRKSGATTKRYFESPVAEAQVTKIKLKRKSEQKFDGDTIKVGKPKPTFPKRRPGFKKKYKKILDTNTEKPQHIPKELLEKYSRGEKVKSGGVRTKFFKEKYKRKEVYLDYATEQAARTEILLEEVQGFIEPDDGEVTAEYRQEEIVKNVDIQSASKHFKLNLEFGPYSMRYTKNGRYLLLGGRRGHVASFDWITKKLHCEINVMEEVADVTYLHNHTMFACAQKKWVYFYDSQGTELHCVKRLNTVNRMEFLPYHFLLATVNSSGYASWLDVSIGELVGNINTHLGDIRIMRNNPSNGVLCIGGGKGVVSMWSPKVREPLAKLLAHATPMSALTIDPTGVHMVTAGLDRRVKVWDVRALSGPLAEYHLQLPAHQLEVSQRGVLAFAQGNHCEMYTNVLIGKQAVRPYLKQTCDGFIHGIRFCPYEDILGVSTAKGFQSLLVPGSGEPNFDAYEDNPYQTKSQRRESEVHALLEKIPPELITLNPSEIASVDVPTLQEKIDAKRSVFFVKPPQIKISMRHKMKGRGGSVKASRNKQIVKDLKRKEFIAEQRKSKQQIIKDNKVKDKNQLPLKPDTKTTALDRFIPKKKKI